jgi:DNA-directed RNA polymerase subunit RPC12/RpoP
VPSTENAGPVEIVCPHCKKRFSGELLYGGAERYRGFKCPHCKLFVPAERVESEADASS